jgi:hypothetical protein
MRPSARRRYWRKSGRGSSTAFSWSHAPDLAAERETVIEASTAETATTFDADWYFPTEGEPDKFLYFQHGFPARAGFYDLTSTRSPRLRPRGS